MCIVCLQWKTAKKVYSKQSGVLKTVFVCAVDVNVSPAVQCTKKMEDLLIDEKTDLKSPENKKK